MSNPSINLYQAIALYIAAILGSGVLFLTGTTASLAGPISIVSWLIAILFSIPLAYSFACMSRLDPDAGGAATFVKKAFSPSSGALIGWFYFACASVGQIIVSLTGASYIGIAFDLSIIETTMVAMSILLLAGMFNHIGLQISGRFSLILSSILLILLLVTIISSLPRVQWEHFVPFAPFGVLPLGTAVTLILWSFFGWEAICNLANRFKNVQKDIVRSSMISAMIIGVVFLGLSFVTIGTVTYGDPEKNIAPVGIMIYDSFGMGAKVATAVLAFIICLGTVNAFVASLGQLGYALSRDGVFPRFFIKLHPATDTPRRVIWFVILFSTVGVIGTNTFSISMDSILFIPNSLGLMVYIFSMAAGLKLFEKWTLPWYASLVSLVLSVLLLPFFGIFILVPMGVGGVYFLYLYFRKRGMESGNLKRSYGGIDVGNHEKW